MQFHLAFLSWQLRLRLVVVRVEDSRSLIRQQNPLLARQRAAEEVLQSNRITNYGSNVKLLCLKVSKPLDFGRAFATAKASTEVVQAYLSDSDFYRIHTL